MYKTTARVKYQSCYREPFSPSAHSHIASKEGARFARAVRHAAGAAISSYRTAGSPCSCRRAHLNRHFALMAVRFTWHYILSICVSRLQYTIQSDHFILVVVIASQDFCSSLSILKYQRHHTLARGKRIGHHSWREPILYAHSLFKESVIRQDRLLLDDFERWDAVLTSQPYVNRTASSFTSKFAQCIFHGVDKCFLCTSEQFSKLVSNLPQCAL